VLDVAKGAGMEQDKRVTHLRALLQRAQAAGADDDRDQYAKRACEYATRIRGSIETAAERITAAKERKLQAKARAQAIR
jgi:hypothetical protein